MRLRNQIEREGKRKKEEENEKEGEEEKKEKEREKKRGRTRKLPARPPTEKSNAVTIHPVAPANYIMIFNGPKSKTRPPKIFGSGIDWDELESSEMS